jgi:hypothetical protein
MSSNGFGIGSASVIKIDNAQGVLTDISAYCTGVALPQNVRTLDVRPLASANEELLAIGNGAVLQCVGNYHQIVDSILWNAKGTARSIEYYPIGTSYPYYSGEVLGLDYQPASPLQGIANWSFTAQVQGALTRTAPQIASLQSHWKLDETSGNRSDSHGSNTLVDNNTVTSATGLLDKAASFASATSESLSIADNASTSIGLGVSFAYAGAVRLATKSADMHIVSKGAGGPGTVEYSLIYNSSADRFALFISDGVSFGTVQDTVIGNVSTGTWYFIFFGYNATLGKGFLQINNGTMQLTAAHAGAQNSTNALTFGAQSGGGAHLNGLMDSWSFWKDRVPSAAEMTTIYNNGLLWDYPW